MTENPAEQGNHGLDLMTILLDQYTEDSNWHLNAVERHDVDQLAERLNRVLLRSRARCRQVQEVTEAEKKIIADIPKPAEFPNVQPKQRQRRGN
jgi:hypothetical protein